LLSACQGALGKGIDTDFLNRETFFDVCRILGTLQSRWILKYDVFLYSLTRFSSLRAPSPPSPCRGSSPPLWGQISPGSTRRLEGLARGLGPVTSQGFPFVGRARTTGGVDRSEKEADSGPGNPSDSCAIRSNRPTFLCTTPLNIGAD
jgi:hypothetical protein